MYKKMKNKVKNDVIEELEHNVSVDCNILPPKSPKGHVNLTDSDSELDSDQKTQFKKPTQPKKSSKPTTQPVTQTAHMASQLETTQDSTKPLKAPCSSLQNSEFQTPDFDVTSLLHHLKRAITPPEPNQHAIIVESHSKENQEQVSSDMKCGNVINGSTPKSSKNKSNSKSSKTVLDKSKEGKVKDIFQDLKGDKRFNNKIMANDEKVKAIFKDLNLDINKKLSREERQQVIRRRIEAGIDTVVTQPQKRANLEPNDLLQTIDPESPIPIKTFHEQIQSKIDELKRMSLDDLLPKYFTEGVTDLPEGCLLVEIKYQFVSAKGQYKSESKFVLDKLLTPGKPRSPRRSKVQAINKSIVELIKALSNTLERGDLKFKFEYYCALGRKIGVAADCVIADECLKKV